MSYSRFSLPSVALSLLLLAGGAFPVAAADLIRIENMQWGFDGKVMPHAFNPLSFEVYNDSVEPEEFDLVLRRSNGVTPVDAPIVIQKVALAPESGRRVQMFPYILNGWSDWTLTWGRGEHQQFAVNQQQLTLGSPATVVLYDPLAVTPPGGGGLPRFDESFFPISVSGTSGLDAAVLDHNPRDWQTSTIKARAFLDWLHAGGTLHLLQSSDGVWPEFEAPLDDLNAPLDEYRIGAGLVVRHPITFTRLNRTYAEQEMFPRQSVQRKPESPAQQQQQQQQNTPVYGRYVNWDTSDLMFSRMKQMTKADHNWPLIYVMALVYLLVIFPGCWLIGRRRADYRVTYGVMIGAVVLFSMGFKAVGQRGYGEATALHSVTIARPAGDGRLLIQQWTNLFVTDGDDYQISHPGDGLLYSSGQTNEAVNGIIVNLPGGAFIVDVPPFSSRTIASSAVLPDQPLNVTATLLDARESRLRDLRVSCDPALVAAMQEAAVLFHGNVYTMARQDDGALQLRGGGVPLNNFLQTDSWSQGYYGPGFYGWEDDPDPEQLFQTAMRPLVARSLGIHDDDSLKTTEMANDRVRLFVYADMPEELSPQCEYVDGDPLQAQKVGRVLYVIDLFPPEQSPDETAEP